MIMCEEICSDDILTDQTMSCIASQYIWKKCKSVVASSLILNFLLNCRCCHAEIHFIYSKTCLKQNLKGPEHFSAKARFPFNQGTIHIKIKPGHARI